MKYLFCFAISLYFQNIVCSQTIQDKFKLDTLIFLNHKNLTIEKIRKDAIISSTDKYIHIAFSNNVFGNDTNYIISINKSSYKVSYWSFCLPKEMKTKTLDAIYSFSTNDSIFALGFYQSILVLSTNSENQLRIVKLIELEQSCAYLKVIDNKVFAGNIYKKKDVTQCAVIYKYGINEQYKEVDRFTFNYPCIEFSYFSPNHWIEIDKENIFIAQTCNYSIDIYNHSFKKKGVIETKKKSWIEMDKSILKTLNHQINATQPVQMIDSLSIYNDQFISRVTGIWKFNDTILFIGWFKFDSTLNKTRKHIDVYNLSSNSFLEENLYDPSMFRRDSAIATKDFYPIMYWNYNLDISNNNLTTLRNYAEIEYINNPWKTIYENEKKYFIKNNPIPTLFIYEQK